MRENDKKKNDIDYFTIFVVVGIILGMIFDQILTGFCAGATIGIALDNKKEK